ncbi:MFS transporter [Pseudogracilibacillus auburnensis]|uniref:MFS transporter n=1 Tax=Pseudogracilibacillus auburnensis TaxID=1494959 RepID=A0A2V3VUC1_9BACI|nr:MFS transporter [Pseudogracilibacillus auburnensis]PXW85256.1 MFS transporter [Pseudogracilibacillus auburnensis]
MNMPYKEILKEKNFINILIGRFSKRSALILFSIELIWLTMELTNHSPLLLSLVVMAETLPFILFGIYGGVKADRWNKKTVIVISDIGIAVLLISLPILYQLNMINYFILMAITVMITLFSCFSEPCFRAIIPELLPKSKLQEGNALLDSLQRGASILVPVSIGIVLKITTEIHLFSLAFILILIAAIFHLLISYKPKQFFDLEEKPPSTLNDIKQTIGYLKKHKDILFIMLVQGISIMINTGLWRVGLPIYLETYLGKDIDTFGYITGILGATSFGTSILLGLLKRISQLIVFNAGIILWGTGLLAIGIYPSITIIYVATILIGIGQASEGLARVVILQNQVPRNILGKVFSISSSLNYTSDTLSLGAISGILAIFSTAIVFSGGGVAILLTGIIGAITLKTKSNNQMQGNTDNKFIC